MSDSNKSPFNQQLTKWWDLVSAKDTWDAFKKFFELVWIIIKETGMLIYLFILGGLVSIGWVVDRSTELTENVKSIQTQANQAENGNILAETGKSLVEATKKGADNALQTARAKLDIKVPAKKVKEPVGAKPAGKPSTSPSPAAEKVKSSPPAEASSSDKSKAEESKTEEKVERISDSQEPQEES